MACYVHLHTKKNHIDPGLKNDVIGRSLLVGCLAWDGDFLTSYRDLTKAIMRIPTVDRIPARLHQFIIYMVLAPSQAERCGKTPEKFNNLFFMGLSADAEVFHGRVYFFSGLI